MEKLTHKEAFLQSLDRCTKDEGFISAFYKRFLNSSQEVQKKFHFTDFEKQESMLLASLRVTAGATVGDPVALSELRERAISHDRYHLNVEPRLYEFWLTAILLTAAEYDDQWDAGVEEAWRTILEYVIKHMIKHY